MIVLYDQVLQTPPCLPTLDERSFAYTYNRTPRGISTTPSISNHLRDERTPSGLVKNVLNYILNTTRVAAGGKTIFVDNISVDRSLQIGVKVGNPSPIWLSVMLTKLCQNKQLNDIPTYLLNDCLFATYQTTEMGISQILTWDLIHCRLDIITFK